MDANVLIINRRDVVKAVLCDLTLFLAVYFIPVLSHATSVPLYMFEPMRLLLFVLIFMTPKLKVNHYLVAFTLPLVSYLFSGHPLFLKSLIMSIELVTNVAFLHILLKHTNVFLSIAGSILISKVVYYLIKIAFVSLGLLKMEIISTSIIWQVITLLMLSTIGAIISKIIIKE